VAWPDGREDVAASVTSANERSTTRPSRLLVAVAALLVLGLASCAGVAGGEATGEWSLSPLLDKADGVAGPVSLLEVRQADGCAPTPAAFVTSTSACLTLDAASGLTLTRQEASSRGGDDGRLQQPVVAVALAATVTLGAVEVATGMGITIAVAAYVLAHPELSQQVADAIADAN
jgi:hypothetical protein